MALREQSHDLVRVRRRIIGRNVKQTLAFELLNQLGSGSLVLDQDARMPVFPRLIPDGTLELRVVKKVT